MGHRGPREQDAVSLIVVRRPTASGHGLVILGGTEIAAPERSGGVDGRGRGGTLGRVADGRTVDSTRVAVPSAGGEWWRPPLGVAEQVHRAGPSPPRVWGRRPRVIE